MCASFTEPFFKIYADCAVTKFPASKKGSNNISAVVLNGFLCSSQPTRKTRLFNVPLVMWHSNMSSFSWQLGLRSAILCDFSKFLFTLPLPKPDSGNSRAYRKSLKVCIGRMVETQQLTVATLCGAFPHAPYLPFYSNFLHRPCWNCLLTFL